MRMRSSSGLVFGLVVALVGCGNKLNGASPDPKPVAVSDVNDICDGSDAIRIGIRHDDFHNIADVQHFFYEGGHTFLYVTGRCEVWIGGECPDDWGPSSTAWCGYRRTPISREELAELLNDIGWAQWRAHDGEEIGTPSGATVYTVFGQDFSLTFKPERILGDDQFSGYMRRWHQAVDRLAQTSEPATTPCVW